MGVLKLENCKNCSVLPSLGQMSSLKDLTIIGMTGIKRIGSEMYGENSAVLSFQSLESLCFEDLAEWVHWDPADEHVEIFPCLCKLSIVQCPKLSERLPAHLSSLEKLMIRDCPELVASLSSVSMLCELTMDGYKSMVCTSPTELQLLKSMTLSNISDHGNWLLQGFPKEDRLKVVGFEGSRQLWQSEISIGKIPQGQHSFTSLRDLCIKDCPSLVSFPDASLFSCLRELKVVNCSSLTSFPEGLLLECLKIEGCDSLTFFTKGQIPSPLKKLTIKNCKKLQSVLYDRDYSCTSSSVLQFPESLRSLVINECPKLESIEERFHKNSSLEIISLYKCKELKFLPEGLHNLSCLRRIYVFGCEKLKALPNHMHSLKSLKGLTLFSTSLLSFPEEGFPVNLTCLRIADQNICKPLFEWGVHKPTSLKELSIGSSPHVVSFRDEEIGMILPSSLIHLEIQDFPKLKRLSSKGFQNLTSLKYLSIQACPNLTSFPEVGFVVVAFEFKHRCMSFAEKTVQKGYRKRVVQDSPHPFDFHG